MKKIRLIAMDMDGTLVNSRKEITDETIGVLQQAIQAGVAVTVATGRTYRAMHHRVHDIGIDMPIICTNGACIRNSEKIFYMNPMEIGDVAQAIAFCKAHGAEYFIFAGDQIFRNQDTPLRDLYEKWHVEEYEKAGNPILKTFTTDAEMLEDAKDKALQLLIVQPDLEKLLLLQAELRRRVNLHIVHSEPHMLDAIHLGVTKGAALKHLAEQMGIAREEIMAIGDGENDKDMIAFAGLGVAMGNAFDEVKEAADFITKDHDHEGVAYAVRKFVLGEE